MANGVTLEASGERVVYDGEIAAIYDNDSHGIYGASYDDVLSMIPRDARFDRVLDVGVGTGTVLARLAEAFHPTTLYGLDPSPAMLELASKKVPGLVPVLGNDSALATDETLRDLDLVMANFVLAYSGPEKMIERVRHTLKKGGLFAVTTTTMRSFREFLDIAKHPIFRVISLGYGISPETVEKELPPVPKDPEDLRAHLERGGFEVLDVRARVHPLRFKDGRALYEFGREGGWWLDLYQRMSVTDRSVPWLHLGMRACQLLRLLDRDCTTSMETCAIVARLRG